MAAPTVPGDISTLLETLNPEAGLVERHIWLIRTLDWVRRGEPVSGLQNVVRLIDANPERRALVVALLGEGHLEFRDGLAEFGMVSDLLLEFPAEVPFDQRVRLGADRDLAFLHGFEQGTLDLGWSAVDFVGEDEVGEDRAFARGEAAGLRIVNLRADDVGGQHVRSELQAREFRVEAIGQRFD